jgi:hypothetical protein
MNHGDQPVPIPADVEDREPANTVGMGKAGADIGEIPPNFTPGRLMPCSQGHLGI